MIWTTHPNWKFNSISIKTLSVNLMKKYFNAFILYLKRILLDRFKEDNNEKPCYHPLGIKL